jgi:hypothetical protein
MKLNCLFCLFFLRVPESRVATKSQSQCPTKALLSHVVLSRYFRGLEIHLKSGFRIDAGGCLPWPLSLVSLRDWFVAVDKAAVVPLGST